VFQLFALVLRNADKSTVRPFIPCSARHFKKGAKFAGSVGHQMTKMLSASGGASPPWPGALPLDPAGCSAPDPRYRLVLCTRHGPLQLLLPPMILVPRAPPLILTSLRLCPLSLLSSTPIETDLFHKTYVGWFPSELLPSWTRRGPTVGQIDFHSFFIGLKKPYYVSFLIGLGLPSKTESAIYCTDLWQSE